MWLSGAHPAVGWLWGMGEWTACAKKWQKELNGTHAFEEGSCSKPLVPEVSNLHQDLSDGLSSWRILVKGIAWFFSYQSESGWTHASWNRVCSEDVKHHYIVLAFTACHVDCLPGQKYWRHMVNLLQFGIKLFLPLRGPVGPFTCQTPDRLCFGLGAWAGGPRRCGWHRWFGWWGSTFGLLSRRQTCDVCAHGTRRRLRGVGQDQLQGKSMCCFVHPGVA